MVKNNSSNQEISNNLLKKIENDRSKPKKQIKKPLFVYDNENNALKLTVQLPHSFTLEKTLLSCILIHCGESFQTLEIII